MPVDQTLARARAELAAGDTARARQRLRSLVAVVPHRLDVRDALAATYRAEGDLVQAGRWSYLTPDAVPAEVAAFLAARTHPVGRVRAMRWSGPEDAAGAFAAARLAELRVSAEAETGGPVPWSGPLRYPAPPPRTLGDRLVDWSLLGAVLAVLLLAVVGLVTWSAGSGDASHP